MFGNVNANSVPDSKWVERRFGAFHRGNVIARAAADEEGGKFCRVRGEDGAVYCGGNGYRDVLFVI